MPFFPRKTVQIFIFKVEYLEKSLADFDDFGLILQDFKRQLFRRCSSSLTKWRVIIPFKVSFLIHKGFWKALKAGLIKVLGLQTSKNNDWFIINHRTGLSNATANCPWQIRWLRSLFWDCSWKIGWSTDRLYSRFIDHASCFRHFYENYQVLKSSKWWNYWLNKVYLPQILKGLLPTRQPHPSINHPKQDLEQDRLVLWYQGTQFCLTELLPFGHRRWHFLCPHLRPLMIFWKREYEIKWKTEVHRQWLFSGQFLRWRRWIAEFWSIRFFIKF